MNPFRMPLLGALLVVALSCQSTGPARAPDYEEDFETACGGFPCDWFQSTGPPGGVQWTGTFHAGDRGLSIFAGSEAVHSIARPWPRPSPRATGELVARCDAGAQLRLTLYPEAGTPTRFTFDPNGTSFQPLPFGLAERTDAGPPGLLVSISLTVEGAGRCDVDRVLLGAELPVAASLGCLSP